MGRWFINDLSYWIKSCVRGEQVGRYILRSFGMLLGIHPVGWSAGRCWLLSMDAFQRSTMKWKTHVAPNTTRILSKGGEPTVSSFRLNLHACLWCWQPVGLVSWRWIAFLCWLHSLFMPLASFHAAALLSFFSSLWNIILVWEILGEGLGQLPLHLPNISVLPLSVSF